MAAYGDEIRIDTTEIEGLAELLNRFPVEVEEKMVQRSLEQGAIIVRQAIMEAAPVRTDDKTSRSTSLPAGYVKADIRIAPRRRGRGWVIGAGAATAYVVRWLEFGHMIVRGKSGIGGGHVPAHPFLRPGFDASWRNGLDAIYAELVRQMDDYWRKTVRAMKKAG